jgi:RNA polymerase sigma-70 factor (ECF subfamily)
VSDSADDGAGEVIRRGDGARRQLDLLYRERAPALRRRLRMRTGSSEEANDIVHEAFARLVRAAGFQGLRQPEAFLGRIVRNLLIDRSRRLSGRSLHVPIDEAGDIPVRAEQEDLIEAEQMAERYRKAVASLPPRMREVFLLHRVEELDYREIAVRLQISVRTVEWHFAEAIVRIGKELDIR